jgi:hypothetical protein
VSERDQYRLLLDEALENAARTLASAEREREAAGGVAKARAALAKAHAAKAEDALHGANQLSLSAQRAPTSEACDDGWRRVAGIVAVAQTSAQAASTLANELEQQAPGSSAARAAHTSARRAEAAARAARRLVEARNDAYTFHADGGFSFGEGWYVAAAAVLAGVTVQIEPGREGTAQAEKFLGDAGLAGQLRPYRSRPRAMKQITALVARAFELDPRGAQQRLRAAFLGADPLASAVSEWVDRRLAGSDSREGAPKKVLLWIRDGTHHPARNTNVAELLELVKRVQRARLVPMLIGDALRGEPVPDGCIDLILFWKDPLFRRADQRRAQLSFFEHLRRRHGLVGQLGVTTAGMDGPALLGLPTLYLTSVPNVRMGQWVGAVPGYEEIVRESGYLERIGRVLATWAAHEAPGS